MENLTRGVCIITIDSIKFLIFKKKRKEMAGAQLSRNEVVQMIIRVSLVSVATYFSVKWMISQIGRHKTSAHILFPTIKIIIIFRSN